MKEGKLPSCLSNSNLKQSSLASAPRPFQPHLEAAAMSRGPRKQAFPHTMGKSQYARQLNSTRPHCHYPSPETENRQELLSFSDTEGPSLPRFPDCLRPHCLLGQLPGPSQSLSRASRDRSCHKLPVSERPASLPSLCSHL